MRRHAVRLSEHAVKFIAPFLALEVFPVFCFIHSDADGGSLNPFGRSADSLDNGYPRSICTYDWLWTNVWRSFCEFLSARLIPFPALQPLATLFLSLTNGVARIAKLFGRRYYFAKDDELTTTIEQLFDQLAPYIEFKHSRPVVLVAKTCIYWRFCPDLSPQPINSFCPHH
jgi:hypothetical protein